MSPADLVVLGPAQLVECAVRDVIERRELVFAAGEGDLRGSALASALFADCLVLDPECVATLDSAEAWSGAVWRLGAAAYRLFLTRGTRLTAAEALEIGLCEDVAATEDPAGLAERWLARRSPRALGVAAALIRLRGGDALERAEFAWLFATGEPQHGLAAFLEKRRPEFGRAGPAAQHE